MCVGFAYFFFQLKQEAAMRFPHILAHSDIHSTAVHTLAQNAARARRAQSGYKIRKKGLQHKQHIKCVESKIKKKPNKRTNEKKKSKKIAKEK